MSLTSSLRKPSSGEARIWDDQRAQFLSVVPGLLNVAVGTIPCQGERNNNSKKRDQQPVKGQEISHRSIRSKASLISDSVPPNDMRIWFSPAGPKAAPGMVMTRAS